MNTEEFIERLTQVCAFDTSADPDGWTDDCPLWGHCAVASVLAQDYFGGSVLRGSLKNHPKYAYLRSHFWNKLLDGTEVDVTASQYSDLAYTELKSEERSRETILSHPGTTERYKVLKKRFESA